MKILVLSCDKDVDTFNAFHHCMEKYWPTHHEIIYATETVINPYYKTICKNYDLQHWTKRIRETLAEIDDDQVLVMCDDTFIRSKVDCDKVDYLEKILKKYDIAAINLEKSFDINDKNTQLDHLKVRSSNGEYKTSVLCSMYDRKSLIDMLSIDRDPWMFELANNHLNLTYLICDSYIIDMGHYKVGDKWGIYRGKWCKECLDFFKREGVIIDSSERGVYE